MEVQPELEVQRTNTPKCETQGAIQTIPAFVLWKVPRGRPIQKCAAQTDVLGF